MALSLQTPHLQGRGHSSICHSRWRLTLQGGEVTSSLRQSILFPLLLEREVIPKLEPPVGGRSGGCSPYTRHLPRAW